ncbi:MAG: lipooligosaccharide transport system permease protein [Frankiales bacterium]|nr:lipooligosaccharide transport system permease protein [Frankiales bacterium]
MAASTLERAESRTSKGSRLALHEFSYQLHRYRRTWRGTIVVSVVNPLLFLLAIGVGLGKVVANHPAGLHGATYLAFFAPGMLAAAAMQNGIVEGGFPVSRAVMPSGSYSVTVTTPLDSTDIMLGQSLYMAFKLALSAVTFVAVMACFGATRSWWSLAAIPAATLTGLAFATPTMAWAAGVRNPRAVFGAFKWVVMPLYLFSGTFFPVTQLPIVLRALAYATPLWHGVDLCRTLSLGTATWARTAGHVGYLLAFTVIGVVLAARSYRRRLYG